MTVAEILKNNKLAVEQSKPASVTQTVNAVVSSCTLTELYFGCLDNPEVSTGLDAFNDDGRERAVQKPKMEIVLCKSESFDETIAQQTRHCAVKASLVSMPDAHIVR